MRLHWLACFLILGLCYVKAEPEVEVKKSEVTKLEVVDLGEVETDSDAQDSEVQRKRESGYSYNRPNRFALASRARAQVGQFGYKGRIVNKHPAQIHRPVTKYGPPTHQNSPSTRPSAHSQQHGDKLHQQHGHFNQQHSGNFNSRPTLLQQEVPSPIRHFDFVEPNPIASQNNQPFESNSANYLPPGNQKLPAYAPPDAFSPQSSLQITQSNGQQSQNLIQHQENPISDAALFLSQNAAAIQQLYGAPATEQDFAPSVNEFLGQSEHVENTNAQLQSVTGNLQNSQVYTGSLPSYASGTLNPQETLQKIQSLEKDRLIVQLQQALAVQSQSQNLETAGRYAQNHASFVDNQELLASLGQRMKIHGLNTQENTLSFGSSSTPFNQSPFLPGTTINPTGIATFNYGISTTTQTPTTPKTITTTTVSSIPSPQDARGDGTGQIGVSLPSPGQPQAPPTKGFPVYGGFVPTIFTNPTFVAGVPAYGTSFLAPGAVTTTIQSSGTSPTHFGIPIPTESGQKPPAASPPSKPPSTPTTTTSPSRPSASPAQPPFSSVPLPVHPVTTLHPVATPFRPVVTPVHPVTSVHPVVPAQTPSTTVTGGGHPTFGLQTPSINPVVLKPVKPVYPVYYYPNVAYHLQKPVVPTYPWSYAPTYAQTKPLQIWK